MYTGFKVYQLNFKPSCPSNPHPLNDKRKYMVASQLYYIAALSLMRKSDKLNEWPKTVIHDQAPVQLHISLPQHHWVLSKGSSCSPHKSSMRSSGWGDGSCSPQLGAGFGTEKADKGQWQQSQQADPPFLCFQTKQCHKIQRIVEGNVSSFQRIEEIWLDRFPLPKTPWVSSNC